MKDSDSSVQSKKSVIHVVMIADNNYAMLTAVALTSLKANKKRTSLYRIHILANGIKQENQDKLKSLSTSNFEVNLIEAERDNQGFKKENLHVSTAAILKFEIPQFLPELEKVIYLDGDVIVQKDLEPLFEMDIQDRYAAVVKDIVPLLVHKQPITKKLGISHEFYFNSGVMLLNLKKIRQDNLTEKLYDYRENGINYFMDQDALNVCFAENVEYISPYFNLVASALERVERKTYAEFYGISYYKADKKYIDNAYILHLAGAEKPWKKYKKYLTEAFVRYYKKSPYQNEKLEIEKQSLKEKLHIAKERAVLWLKGTKLGKTAFAHRCMEIYRKLKRKLISRKNRSKMDQVSGSGDNKDYKLLVEALKQQKKEFEALQKKYVKMESDLKYLMKIQRRMSEGINKDKISSEIENYRGYGITTEKRKRRIIVSLTSYRGRIYDVHYTIYSLLNQTMKPDEVILWLGNDERNFPNGDEDLPIKIRRLMENGLTVRYCEDIRSYTKLVPALREFPEDIIVTADDDIYYPEEWLERLYRAYEQGGDEMVYCHRIHRIQVENGKLLPYSRWKKASEKEPDSYLNFLTGVGGVLYPPGVLHEDATNEKLFKQLSPLADDVWFWAMAVRNDRKIRVIENPMSQLTYVNIERELNMNGDTTLISENCFQDKNDEQIENVLSEYPDIYKKLIKASRQN